MRRMIFGFWIERAGTLSGCGRIMLGLGSGGIASLNHRLQAGIPPGWTAMDRGGGDGGGGRKTV